jgi:hypothetical protein
MISLSSTSKEQKETKCNRRPENAKVCLRGLKKKTPMSSNVTRYVAEGRAHREICSLSGS